MQLKRQPALFIGHGNPMNAIADNAYTRAIAELGRRLGKPKAIICVSAHWLTNGTAVTHMPKPKTIYDFYGFPRALSNVVYPAPGDPSLAEQVGSLLSPHVTGHISMDEKWGLDHGTWSVLVHMYPEADIPVVQLSINKNEPPSYHMAIGKNLRPLRDEGVLILGSGNIVHNLREISWDEKASPHPLAVEFNRKVIDQLNSRNFEPLLHDLPATVAGKYSVPTLDHYLPALYVLGASTDQDLLSIEYDEIQNASISMLSFRFSN